MKHPIDATNDFAFSMLFGVEANKVLLIDFLNQTLEPTDPIVDLTLQDPQNRRETEKDKLSIVDVVAKDNEGQTFQVDVQVISSVHLKNRMLFYWSNLYEKQLAKSERYDTLQPVHSIWILSNNMLPDPKRYHDIFAIRSLFDGALLTDHLSIHVLELKKYQAAENMGPLQQWLYFFKNSRQWFDLPEKVTRPIMRLAMNVLEDISDKEENYYRYLAIRDARIEQNTINHQLKEAKEELDVIKREALEVEQALQQAKHETHQAKQESQQAKQESQQAKQESQQAKQESLQAKQESQQAKQETEQARQEIEKLQAMLKRAGINPDQ